MKSSKFLGWVMAITLVLAGSAAAKPGYGTLSGVVLDPSGTPQMGATVWLISEDAGGRIVSRLLSNQHGAFFSDHLKPGQYSVRISVAGFLPAMEHHIAVAANLTTLLRVQVDSIFASLDTLRRKSDLPAEPDDWKWVLRSSAATRTILQWRDGDMDLADNTPAADSSKIQRPRGLLQLTSGALQPGSPSNLSNSPASAMSYEQRLGAFGRMLLAGQMSYERGASGTFASVWMPSGTFNRDPETTFVMRQAKVGPDGLVFQGMRLDHSESLALSERLSLRVGAEYLRAGIISSVSALHPHARLDANLAPGWTASLLMAASPLNGEVGEKTGELQSAIAKLDSLPIVLFRDGRPVLEGGWHQELSVKHKLTGRASFEAAVFHDTVRHAAIFGTGPVAGSDFFQDAFSSAFLYDGGRTSSSGTRLAYRQKISDRLDFAVIYSWAGALSPAGELNASSGDLRNSLVTRNHHSLAARVSGKLPGSGTQFIASYKWISGPALTRVDTFGEAAYHVDPNLGISIRQPIPGIGFGGRWEALADFTNLLAQGYMPLHGQDSRVAFVPVLRSFRGGVSFQF
jgi:hypothetical protein